MYVFTFYSYKGGVGRTMALVNVAADLVRRGRTVLIVDFDLEAPGLETYPLLQPKKPCPGIVEFVTEFREKYEVPNLLDYVYETKPIGKKGGRLWVMPAGRRDKAYRRALNELDWQRLYKEEAGFLLFEDTKRGWEIELKPDYVFIDSRTGDTDVLGICTRQLPDSVVLMFVPNEQNLVGLKKVVEDIRREETDGLKKKINLHFVAANVPDLDDEKGILRRHMRAFRDVLKIDELSGTIRRYDNLSLLDQSVFTLDRQHSRLARSYRRLRRRIVKDNLADRDGALRFLKDYPEWMEERGTKEGIYVEFSSRKEKDGLIHRHVGDQEVSIDGKTRLHEIEKNFSGDAEILRSVADCFVKEEEYQRAIRVLDRILQIEPNAPELLMKRAECLVKTGKIEEAANDYYSLLQISPKQISKARSSRHWLTLNPFGKQRLQIGYEQRPLREFCTLARSRISALSKIYESVISSGLELEILAGTLCDFEDGIAVAKNVLLANLSSKVGTLTLLRARCWNEVINRFESAAPESEESSDLYFLALAKWGQTGNPQSEFWERALAVFPRTADGDYRPTDLNLAQQLCWLLWGTGAAQDAIQALRDVMRLAQSSDDDGVFSLWRLRDVSVEGFREDCRYLESMFRGESTRPPFLGCASCTKN